MSREALRLVDYLGHIAQAAERIQKYTSLRFAYDMRNQLSHGYFTVDLGIVWRTVTRNIPVLAEQIKLMVDSMRVDDANQ
jgi:uncharacterized protein with HEPN domain